MSLRDALAAALLAAYIDPSVGRPSVEMLMENMAKRVLSDPAFREALVEAVERALEREMDAGNAALAEVDRLTALLDTERARLRDEDDFDRETAIPALLAAERARIRAAVEGLPTPPRLFALGAYDREAVLAAIDGEDPK